MLSGRSKSFASVAIIFVVVANGWHLGFVQMVAWSNMAWNNAESMAIDEAIQKALDGSDICNLCQIVIDSETNDSGPDLQTIERASKSLLILESRTIQVDAPSRHVQTIGSAHRNWDVWIADSQSPPPKV